MHVLEEVMKSPTNNGMSQNSARPVSDSDPDEMASLVMALPVTELASDFAFKA